MMRTLSGGHDWSVISIVVAESHCCAAALMSPILLPHPCQRKTNRGSEFERSGVDAVDGSEWSPSVCKSREVINLCRRYLGAGFGKRRSGGSVIVALL